MKKQFSTFMLEKNFRNAAELIFDSALNVQAPNNVNLNINIDREKNIDDIAGQMKNCYDQINDSYSEISFDKLWTNAFDTPELLEKQNLKTNDIVVTKAKTAYDNAMNQFKVQQYEQIFETTTSTLRATFQGVVDSVVNL